MFLIDLKEFHKVVDMSITLVTWSDLGRLAYYNRIIRAFVDKWHMIFKLISNIVK